MHIVVAGWITFDGADCAEIIRGGREHILASRAEEGCIAYNWSVDPLETSKIHVFEAWTSPQALGRHLRDPSYWAMRDHLGSFGLSGFDVRLYGAEGTAPFYLEDGSIRDTIFGVSISGD